MNIPDEAAAELREAVLDEILSVVAAFSDSQMETLLTGDLVAAHERGIARMFPRGQVTWRAPTPHSRQ